MPGPAAAARGTCLAQGVHLPVDLGRVVGRPHPDVTGVDLGLTAEHRLAILMTWTCSGWTLGGDGDEIRNAGHAMGLADHPLHLVALEDLVDLAVQGFTNQQVVNQVFISVHTVVFHLRQVFQQTGHHLSPDAIRSGDAPGSRVRGRCP